MPDPVYGEKVACYVVLKPGSSLDLAELQDHLRRRGASVETWPEQLVFVDSLPMSSGGKIAKAELRADISKRLVGAREVPR
jgi:acyl-CoA synthetase